MTSPTGDPHPGEGTAAESGEAAQPPEPGEPQQPGSPPEEEPEHRCDLCGAPMLEWHCRIICRFCGYQRDCSDP